jgi:hypothetical protein
MAEDTTMTDTSSAIGNMEESPTMIDKVNATKSTSLPLEAAAQRLDRLLGGGSVAENERALDFYTNPVKVVRRWLGTSSGAAKGATLEDVKATASKLLDPSGPCSFGRSLLVSSTSPDAEEMIDQDKTPMPLFLSAASTREIESWLISLAVRLLWSDGKFVEAFDLCQKGISIIISHLEQASLRITSASAGSASSLFPLLARFFRLRALVGESITGTDFVADLQSEMAKAYNMASLRRDVDSQATLLNSMLRDLLLRSQGMS